MRIILPKTSCSIDLSYGPVFYLAGPILGGDDWQSRCVEEIRKHLPHFYAIIPCRYGPDHPLMAYKVKDDGRYHYEDQLDWEEQSMELASIMGCLLFWLPKESEINPRNDGDPYGWDTQGEQGLWRGNMKHDPDLRIVVGGEEGFPRLQIIRRCFQRAARNHYPQFRFYSSLPETVQAAIAKVICRT